MEKQFITSIDTLPEKVKINTTRKNVKHNFGVNESNDRKFSVIEITHNSDDAEENGKKDAAKAQNFSSVFGTYFSYIAKITKIVLFILVLIFSQLQLLQCRRNSVLDAFELTCRSGPRRFVSITCANEGNEYVDLAVFLRAGMRSQLDKLVEKKTMGILHAKFRVNMRLRMAHPLLDNDVEENMDTITKQTDDKNNIDENGIELGLLEGQKTWPSGSKTELSKVKESALFLRANTEPKKPGQMKKEPSPYNTYMDVNVLHLAIIAKQIDSIKWIMDLITNDEYHFSENINKL